MAAPDSQAAAATSEFIANRRRRMNIPDAPIAQEGFYAAHFFTVKDQEKSRDFYVRILGGKLIKPEIPATSSWRISGSFSVPAVARLLTSQRSLLKHRRI
jgi:hypothetical protein